MNPEIWGPQAWGFLHSITFNYPKEPTKQDKHNTKLFFSNLGTQLPCMSCKNNYKKHLFKHPLTNKVLSSRENLSRWLVDIHNEVNFMTNKKIYPYEKVVIKYTQSTNNKNSYKILLILSVVILIIYLFYTNKSKI